MPVDEIPEMVRNGDTFDVATGLNFRCDILRYVV